MSAEDGIRRIAARYDGDDDEARRLYEATVRRLEYRRRRAGKECVRCGATKPVADFGRDSTRGDGLEPRCRSCRRVSA